MEGQEERDREEEEDTVQCGNGRIVAWWWHAHLQFFYDVSLGFGSGSHSCFPP